MKSKIASPTGNREILKSMIYYLERQFPGVSFGLSASGDIEVTGAQAKLDLITAKARGYAAATARLSERVKPKVLFTFQPEVATYADGLPEATVFASKIEGVFGLSSPLAKVLQRIDTRFLTLATRLGCAPLQVPVMISRDDLEKAGYLPREQHQIGCVSGLDERAIGYLTPAACLTAYPMIAAFAGTERHFTTVTPVFRMEGGVFEPEHPLKRLREYHVRELMFIGDTIEPKLAQKHYFDFIKALAQDWSLPLEISTATDLFFHPEHSVRAIHQLMHETKYEVNFVRGQERLALSSLNFHGDHFVKAFAIVGASASACVGFGLERWLRALLIRHGSVQVVNEVLERFA